MEKRGGYYEQSGCLRDMIQNHTMQLLALTAMEPPGSLDAEAMRDEKVKVLKAIQPLTIGPADFLFLWRERHRFVALPLRAVPERPRRGIEFEFVPVLCVCDGFRALDEVKAQVQRVPTKDVPHARPAYDDHRASRLLGDRLQPRRGHLARGADGEAVSRDEEGLPRVNARAKARHEIPEGAFLPALVQRGEALGDAILGGRDLVGVDGVALLSGTLGVPENQRAAAYGSLAHRIPRAM